jgi:histidinol-phosphate phosphatase family protein
MSELRRAAFLDRDGTIIQERNYIADPDDVVLLASAVAGMRALRDAGYLLVVVTNQSGIARGLVTPAQYEAVHARMAELLRADGIELDGVYFCPHHPDFTGPCACRKPGTGLYEQAARELGIDLGRSLYIGDKTSDVAAAERLGGTAILVRTGHGRAHAPERPGAVLVARDLAAAARLAAGLPERR